MPPPVQLHVPPPIVQPRVVVVPVQRAVVPVITGMPFTVTAANEEHPTVLVNEIVTVPAATPDTIPVVGPTVAVAVLLLDQVPGPPASASVVVPPAHMEVIPVMGAMAVTLKTIVATQPAAEV
jgi:hypothetical protein